MLRPLASPLSAASAVSDWPSGCRGASRAGACTRAAGAGGSTAGAPEGEGGAAGRRNSGLKQRVEQLEEQLVDMQVVVGTLKSLARGAAARRAAGTRRRFVGNGADSVRLDGIETQVRALAAQIEQLTVQVQALSAASRRTDAGATTPSPSPSGTASTGTAAAGVPDPGRFGSTTVTAGTERCHRRPHRARVRRRGRQRATAPAPPSSSWTVAPPSSDTLAAAPPAFMPRQRRMPPTPATPSSSMRPPMAT